MGLAADSWHSEWPAQYQLFNPTRAYLESYTCSHGVLEQVCVPLQASEADLSHLRTLNKSRLIMP